MEENKETIKEKIEKEETVNNVKTNEQQPATTVDNDNVNNNNNIKQKRVPKIVLPVTVVVIFLIVAISYILSHPFLNEDEKAAYKTICNAAEAFNDSNYGSLIQYIDSYSYVDKYKKIFDVVGINSDALEDILIGIWDDLSSEYGDEMDLEVKSVSKKETISDDELALTVRCKLNDQKCKVRFTLTKHSDKWYIKSALNLETGDDIFN